MNWDDFNTHLLGFLLKLLKFIECAEAELAQLGRVLLLLLQGNRVLVQHRLYLRGESWWTEKCEFAQTDWRFIQNKQQKHDKGLIQKGTSESLMRMKISRPEEESPLLTLLSRSALFSCLIFTISLPWTKKLLLQLVPTILFPVDWDTSSYLVWQKFDWLHILWTLMYEMSINYPWSKIWGLIKALGS